MGTEIVLGMDIAEMDLSEITLVMPQVKKSVCIMDIGEEAKVKLEIMHVMPTMLAIGTEV